MLLACPPRLMAHIPFSHLASASTRSMPANSLPIIVGMPISPTRRKPLLPFLCVLAATICVSGLLTQME
jgi:hypothetical protein